MSITNRQSKGSALTITELDNNFNHFTGSHAISGSLTVSGSLIVTGSANFNLGVTASALNISNNLFLSSSTAALASLTDGHLQVSGSDLYFRSGSAWNKVSFV